MSIGRDAAPAYSEELRSSNIARTTSTYDVDRLGEFTLSYKKKIGRHHIDALAGLVPWAESGTIILVRLVSL